MKKHSNFKALNNKSDDFKSQHVRLASQILEDKIANQIIEGLSKRTINDPFKQVKEGSKTPKIRPTHAGRRFLLSNENKRNSQQNGNLQIILENNYKILPNEARDNRQAYKYNFENITHREVSNHITSIKASVPQTTRNSAGFVSPRQRQLVQAGSQVINDSSPRLKIPIFFNQVQQNSNVLNLKKQLPQDFKELPGISQKPNGFVGTYRANKYKRVQSANKNSQHNKKSQQLNVNLNAKIILDNDQKESKTKKGRSLTPQPVIGFNFPLENEKKVDSNQKQNLPKSQLYKQVPNTPDFMQTERNTEPNTMENSYKHAEKEFQIFKDLNFCEKINQYRQNRECKTPQLGTKMSEASKLIIQQQIASQDIIQKKPSNIQLRSLHFENQYNIFETADNNTAFELSFCQDIESISITPTNIKQNEKEFFESEMNFDYKTYN